MPQMRFSTVPVTFSGSPSSTGVISANSSTSFPTNVLTAAAAIQAMTVSFGSSDHHVRTLGASISNVQWNGPTVSFSASLQLEDDSGNKISTSNSSLDVLVMAWTE